MAGPDREGATQSRSVGWGCAVPLVLAAVLVAVFVLFRPAPPSLPARLVSASSAPIVVPGAVPAKPPVPAAGAAPPASSGLQFPALTGRVVDAANIIPADVEARLTQKLAALETQSRRQLVVATLPSLQGYEISDYGYQLGRAWGLGDKARNDGALLIVAPNERKVRFEVGYGLEPILPDSLAFLIIQNSILPKFKAGDVAGGIEAGTDVVISQLTLPDEEARKVAAEAKQAQADGGGISFGTVLFLLFIFFFFILPIFRAMRGGRRYSGNGMGPVIIWPGSFGGGGGGFGGGGGGFGGGGFSGGGGSFGGGGASGSW